MKVIIAGSRSISSLGTVEDAVRRSGFSITEVVSGAARGVDRLGEQWAEREGIAVKRFPADWEAYGKSAGFIRNRQMGDYADALIAIWDGKSKGTKGMIDYAMKRGLRVFVWEVSPVSEQPKQASLDYLSGSERPKQASLDYLFEADD